MSVLHDKDDAHTAANLVDRIVPSRLTHQEAVSRDRDTFAPCGTPTPSPGCLISLATLLSLSSATVERGEKGATAVSGGGSAGLLLLWQPGRHRSGWRSGEAPCGCT